MEQEQPITTRDLLLEMRADLKSALLGQAILGERVENIIDTQAQVKEDLRNATDEVTRKIDAHIADDNAKHEAGDARVKTLENWRSRIMGMLVIVGAGLGFLGAIAKDAIAAAWPWGH